MRTPNALLAASAALLALMAFPGRPAAADTILLKDGRTVECKKAEKQEDGAWKLTFEHGEIVVPAALVKDAFCEGAQGYEPKNDEEKALVEKGLVPYEGKWISKTERDSRVARKTAASKKKIEEAKAHREWRNRYKTKTANFEFEYTIPPEIAKSYMDLMETYYGVMTKQFNASRPPKEKLKVCFYHDYDTFLEVSGAGYGVLAYYRFVPPRELNFYYDRLRPDETTAIMFHEAQHFMSHLLDLKFNMPHNLGEAFAEYYGGSKWDPVKKVMTTGGVQEGRLTEVQTDMAAGERKSLQKYLLGELGYDDYTWGWTFVHFMMETPAYGKKFRAFYVALARGKDVQRSSDGDFTTVQGGQIVSAFKKYMGLEDLAALEKEWYEYINTKLKVTTVYGCEEAAFAALNTGRRLRAERFFKEAVEKGSTNPTLYLRYGDIVRGKDAKQAEDLYRKGLTVDPLNSALYTALGRLLRSQSGEENDTKGKELIRLAMELDPDDAETWLLVEDAHEAAGGGAVPKPGEGGGEEGGN